MACMWSIAIIDTYCPTSTSKLMDLFGACKFTYNKTSSFTKLISNRIHFLMYHIHEGQWLFPHCPSTASSITPGSGPKQCACHGHWNSAYHAGSTHQVLSVNTTNLATRIAHLTHIGILCFNNSTAYLQPYWKSQQQVQINQHLWRVVKRITALSQLSYYNWGMPIISRPCHAQIQGHLANMWYFPCLTFYYHLHSGKCSLAISRTRPNRS